MGYFVVHLKDGEILNFNNECDNVNCENANVCLFTNIEKSICLGIIPYENIAFIESKETRC